MDLGVQLLAQPGGTKPALILHPSGVEVTFAELDASANRLGHYFRGAGLAPGDVIAILMENNRHLHAVMWAAHRTGLRYTAINTNLTVSEIAYIVADSDAKALVGGRGMRDKCEALELSLAGRMPGLTLIADADIDGWRRYPDCVAAESPEPLPDEREGSLLQYSSGSTGQPKGIWRPPVVAERDHGRAQLTPVFSLVGIDGDSVYLSPAPLYHTAPAIWTMCAQAVGATTVVMERFNASEALKCIEHYGVTHAQFVPTMFVRMLRLPTQVRERFQLDSLQRVVHAAAPCAPDIKRQMIDWWGPIIDEYYGSSEGAGISFIRAEDWLEHPGSVGKPIVGTPYILDEHGNELPAGVVGEIYYEGGYPFEYLNDPAKTRASRSSEGWVTVGDVGYLDDDGYLYLTDRRHHMIISGGVNIYPQEAEHALISHPAVVDAAVFGVPDDDLGQSVKAAVELVDPSCSGDDMARELMAWLHGRLARYKCPRTISFEDRLPRTDAGKLNKSGLIAKYAPSPPDRAVGVRENFPAQQGYPRVTAR